MIIVSDMGISGLINIHRSIFILAASNLSSSLFLTDQRSAPYAVFCFGRCV